MSSVSKKPKLNLTKVRRLGKSSTEEIIEGVLDKETRPIIALLKKKLPDKQFERSVKNYLIIRFVTTIEVYFNELIASLIDTYKMPTQGIFEDEKIELPLSRLDDVSKGKITKGKIIATSFTFQNINDIDKVLSKILGFGFLEELKKWKVNAKGDFVKNWDKFFEILKVRHDVVHTLKGEVPYSVKQLEEIELAIEAFLLLSTELAFRPIFQKTPELLKKNNPYTYKFLSKAGH